MRGGVRCLLLLPALLVLSEQAYGVASCSVSASPLNFGSYSPFSASPHDAVGNVRVSCSLIGLVSVNVSYTIQLSTGSSGSFFPRELGAGSQTLQYNLYTNSARTTVWGNASGGTAQVSDGYLLGLLTVTRDYPVYALIPSGQNVPAGSYADTIVVTLNY